MNAPFTLPSKIIPLAHYIDERQNLTHWTAKSRFFAPFKNTVECVKHGLVAVIAVQHNPSTIPVWAMDYHNYFLDIPGQTSEPFVKSNTFGGTAIFVDKDVDAFGYKTLAWDCDTDGDGLRAVADFKLKDFL